VTSHRDRRIFFESLKMWDRPERELRRQVLEANEDVDYLVEKLFQNAFEPES